MKIKKNDTVQVISGTDKGKTGRVIKVYPDRERVVVEGINNVKRHMRPTQDNPQGGIMEKEASIHVSNVMLMVGGKATRVGYKILEDGKKVRYSKKTGDIVD
jgi:large subunit ribosomal protein L24